MLKMIDIKKNFLKKEQKSTRKLILFLKYIILTFKIFTEYHKHRGMTDSKHHRLHTR